MGGLGSSGNRKLGGNSFVSRLNSVLAQAENADKSTRIEAKRNFAKWLDTNLTVTEQMVNSNEHIISVTQNKAWYQNKSGTLFLLGNDLYWHKLGNDLKLYKDRKISENERTRIINLLKGNTTK